MRKRRQSGSAIVEASLMVPWIFFLFVGVLDFGFYAYAAICTQNAARAVAVSQATGNVFGASICQVALGELQQLPNMAGVSSCGTYPTAPTQSSPVSVCVATITTAGAVPSNCSAATTCADCTLNTSSSSIQATVQYQTVPLIPIPGILMGQMTLTRTAEVRVIQ
jgi:hypothetical protein